MPHTSTAGMHGCFLLSALFVASLRNALAEPEAGCLPDSSCAKPLVGASLLATDTRLAPGFNSHMEDPFAELIEAPEEDLLQIDEAPASSVILVEEAQEALRKEPTTPLGVSPTSNRNKILQHLAPSVLVFVLVTTIGVCMSSLTDALLHNSAGKAGKKKDVIDGRDDTPSQGPGPTSPAASSADGASGTASPTQLPPESALTAAHQEEEGDDEYGCTTLHFAADRGAAVEVRSLLAGGAAVNSREAWDETPLHFAARNGNVEVCELLLAHGAELNPVNASDCTPLFVAAQAGKEEACKFLLGRGAHAGSVSDAELPPLISALLVEQIFEQVAEPVAATSE
uniref:Ankyrin repeat-containing protein n=1 Tax=Alexandrium monilatum TaxID=311494 RepID=A0A7S4RUA8_9DINO